MGLNFSKSAFPNRKKKKLIQESSHLVVLRSQYLVSLKLKQMDYLRAFHPALLISDHLPSGGGSLRNTKSDKLNKKLRKLEALRETILGSSLSFIP